MLDVVLEVRVPLGHRGRGRTRRLGKRRPPEVRVHDHAARVDQPPQAQPRVRRDTPARRLDKRSVSPAWRGVTPQDPVALLGDHGSRRPHSRRVRRAVQRRRQLLH